ncbi:hypothetical protein NESM_000182700 [Novymonas esmeraldas]|uniref:Opioid growth factor receptor (OGFr) conserved domain-containing protein n=1 Tax=Novymonas esmeraldas TaxID=1808958 RepID=A0AAW0F5W6_9TRYP
MTEAAARQGYDPPPPQQQRQQRQRQSSPPTRSTAAAAVAEKVGEENDGEDGHPRRRQINLATLHPSVRFYRGLWGLTQLDDSVFGDEDSSTPHRGRPLSVVGLHQLLLPPAPVNGLGEVADESYAVQLAAPDGLEYLRRRWHVLLPLLFPRQLHDASGEVGAAGQDSPSDDRGNSGCEATSECCDTTSPEVAWSTAQLCEELRRRSLSAEDLATVREPGMMDRVYYSYVVLLRFFGWRVHDEERGLVDRHRGWQARYASLDLHRGAPTAPAATAHDEDERDDIVCGDGGASVMHAAHDAPPTYATFDFYASGLPRVLGCLLDIGFLRLAVRLVEFLLEEMSAGRLVPLQSLVEATLLPMIVDHPHVEASHKTRLQRRLYRLTHSDSD